MKVLGILFSLLFVLPFAAHGQIIDLLWQGEVYTPPFYLGRPLWSNQSQITITAIPHTAGNASALVYRWSQDGDFLSAVSGTGKRTFTFADSVLSRTTTIKVEVLSADESQILGTESLTLTPRAPEVIVVEDNPLYGLMLHKAVGDIFTLNESEVSFTALPFFSNLTRRASGDAVYEWTTSVGDTRTGNTVTYRIPEGAEGVSEVTLDMTNSKTLVQPATKKFRVEFGQKEAQL